jgi:hypothetical protein
MDAPRRKTVIESLYGTAVINCGCEAAEDCVPLVSGPVVVSGRALWSNARRLGVIMNGRRGEGCGRVKVGIRRRGESLAGGGGIAPVRLHLMGVVAGGAES